MSRKEFATIQDDLHKLGFITNIQRVHRKCFNVIVNFEIIRTYRNRISCKKRIIKIHKQYSNAPTLF